MIRRPPRSTLDRSSAASDVYKRQAEGWPVQDLAFDPEMVARGLVIDTELGNLVKANPVSYTHLRAHETVLDLVCRLLLEKKKQIQQHALIF